MTTVSTPTAQCPDGSRDSSFSKEQIATAVQVLKGLEQRIQQNDKQQNDKLLAPVRKQVFSLLATNNEAYYAKRQKATKKRNRQHDEEIMATCQLLAGREQKRQKLPQPEHALLDGCVVVAANQSNDDGGERVRLKSKPCYICKVKYFTVDKFYHSLCPSCAATNMEKRQDSVDLSGRVAIVTGGRVKIGFQTALKLLRMNCNVIVTTRFPGNAAIAYAKETDFLKWKHNLKIVALDFRFTKTVEKFCDYVDKTLPRLDILINNAAQTIRRPAQFYSPLVKTELEFFKQRETLLEALETVEALEAENNDDVDISIDKNALLLLGTSRATSKKKVKVMQARGMTQVQPYICSVPESVWASQLVMDRSNQNQNGNRNHNHQIEGKVSDGFFPQGALDINGQQVDLRSKNSWTKKLGQVSVKEAAEALLINALAPFTLNSRLRSLMERSKTNNTNNKLNNKYIVNVTAMEGKFNMKQKTSYHPHTNMAKAALNMMTRTAADDLAQTGIFMNAVDTGWVNDMRPIPIVKALAAKTKTAFSPPLDEIDGAARVLAPIIEAEKKTNCNKPRFGCFLKDYKVTSW